MLGRRPGCRRRPARRRRDDRRSDPPPAPGHRAAHRGRVGVGGWFSRRHPDTSGPEPVHADVIAHRPPRRHPLHQFVAAVAEPHRLADHHLRAQCVDQGRRCLDPQPTRPVNANGFAGTSSHERISIHLAASLPAAQRIAKTERLTPVGSATARGYAHRSRIRCNNAHFTGNPVYSNPSYSSAEH